MPGLKHADRWDILRPMKRVLVPLILAFASLSCLAEGDNERRVFVNEHCVDCHDAETRKGGLDLDALKIDLKTEESMRRWTQVFDRVRAGEMPPKKKRQPDADSKEVFLSSLEDELIRADAARREVVLRRLNRVEYENTISDLFGVRVDVASMLPEDASAHGFDNIGEALAISTEQMGIYLKAADAALDEVFGPDKEPKRIKERMPFKDAISNKGKLQKNFKYVDEGTVLFASGYSPSKMRSPRIRERGLYRLKYQVKTFQSDEAMAMVVYSGDVIANRRDQYLVGYFDVPAGEQWNEVSFDIRLEQYDSFQVKPYRTINYVKPTDVNEFAGPGILIGDMEIEGPMEEWPAKSRTRLLGGADPASGTLDDARRILEALAPRAFRRPVKAEELSPSLGLVKAALNDGRSFVEALRVGLKSILCSPEFLFLEEPARAGRIDDHALAARLSYFFWSSIPDAPLARLAESGKLSRPATLREQVERMLRDPKAERFTKSFTGQWLELREIEFTEPDKILYPEFDEFLRVSMVEETERFFGEILENDLSLLNFVDSDWLIVNSRLAELYEIEGVEGLHFRKVPRPEGSPRGGVMTQGSVLKVSANGTTTSPVIRGNWILQNIIGKPVPPPPANVPGVEPDVSGARTLREQLAKHRDSESCAGCHRRIDPPGFALESFDVIGGWRDWYRTTGDGERLNNRFVDEHGRRVIRVRYKKGRDVDATGVTAQGRAFQDIREYKRILLEDEKQIARCLTEKLLTYGLGRGLGFSDRKEVDRIVSVLAKKNFGLRTLIHEVAQSELFRKP